MVAHDAKQVLAESVYNIIMVVISLCELHGSGVMAKTQLVDIAQNCYRVYVFNQPERNKN